MNRYKDFTANDFALDSSFQQWILSPGASNSQFWNSFAVEFPDKKNDIDEAIKLVKLSGLSTDAEANTAYLEVWDKIQRNSSINTPNKSLVSIRNSRRVYYWAAASAIIGILAMGYYLLMPGATADLVYKTPYAESEEVILPDGSNVTLNANSRLTVHNQHNGGREVTLQGEAFFKIVRTTDQQTFTVKTPTGVNIQVLGTVFNVNTRREQMSVYLQSGRVKLVDGNNEVVLSPGERANIKKGSKEIVVSEETLDAASDNLSWTTGYYIMNDKDLFSISQYIEDNFGARVLLSDSSLNSKSITARVPARNLPVLLKVISETLELNIEEKGGQIIMRPAQVMRE